MPQSHFTGSKLTVEAGSGITAAVGGVYKSAIQQFGDIILTTIFIDLTGLHCGGTAADIIGVAGAANCHIGRITEEECGTIMAGKMTCLELPAGGNADIDVYSAAEATGVEDTAVTALTETLLLNAGASTAVPATIDGFTALPADGEYLYLTVGTTTAAVYTAGKLVIELWGYRA